MNRISLLITLIGMAFVSNAQVTLNLTECEYDDQFEEAYRVDAARLAIRYLYEYGSSDSSSIEIPDHLFEMMMNNLAIARNETSELWQFDVFEKYDIHTNGSPSVNHFSLVLDRDVDWVRNWINDKILSGNAQIDQLIKRYELRVEQMDLPDGNLVRFEITTDQLLNIPALLQRFQNINGVVNGEEVLATSSLNTDIVYYFNSQNDLGLSFTYNWGNCEKACLYQHRWICTLDDETCELIGEARRGDPLSVELFDFFFRLDVFPNPTTNFVNLHMIGPPQREVEVCLFDAYGKKMRSEAINTEQGQLDVEVSLQDLPVGVYFVSFRNGNSIHTEKVFKL